MKPPNLKVKLLIKREYYIVPSPSTTLTHRGDSLGLTTYIIEVQSHCFLSSKGLTLVTRDLLLRASRIESVQMWKTILIFVKIVGVFYNVKKGSSFITSKSLSENLSNHNKYLCFCCLQDKM